MNPEQLLLTNYDVEHIIESNLLQDFYMTYKGMAGNVELGEVARRERLKNEYVDVIKAFFIPNSAAPYGQDAKKPDYNEIRLNAVAKMRSLYGVDIPNFKGTLSTSGYSRRLMILIEHFKIPVNIVLASIYSIVVANTEQDGEKSEDTVPIQQ